MPVKKANLVRVRRELNLAVDRGVERGATMICDLAGQLAPRDTGALSQSGVVEGAAGSRRRKVVFGRGLPDQRAIFQEYGTRTSPAQPYLHPAANAIDVRAEVQAEVRALLGGRG